MGKKIINFNLKASTEIESAMESFVPRFGDQNDIEIVEVHALLKKELTFASEDDNRLADIRAIVATKRNRAIRIKKHEQALLFMLNKRNESI